MGRPGRNPRNEHRLLYCRDEDNRILAVPFDKYLPYSSDIMR